MTLIARRGGPRDEPRESMTPRVARPFSRTSRSREERTNERREEKRGEENHYRGKVDFHWTSIVRAADHGTCSPVICLYHEGREIEWKLRELLKGNIERERKINDNHCWK